MKLSLAPGALIRRCGLQGAFRLIREAGFEAVDYGLDDWRDSRASLCASKNLNMTDEEQYGVKLAIEPLWRRGEDGIIHSTVCSRPEELRAMIDELGSSRFCACPDLGHVALTGKDTGDTPGGFVRKLGGTVEILHLHEVDGIDDSHAAPFTFSEAAMDWADIRAALHEIDYAGTYNFEVGGAYFDRYPDALLPEALRHLYEIGAYLAN